MTTLPTPPRAEKRPYAFEHHGIRVEDPYHWLRDPGYPDVTDPDVLAYLNAENAYFDAAMAPHKALVETLFAEMKGRIKEDDAGVPWREGDWLYWWAFKPGAEYRTWYRKPVAGGEPTVVFDEPAEAEGAPYFNLEAIAVSPDGTKAAVMVDDDGSERFKLRIRDLATGKDIETVTEIGIHEPVWTADSKGVFYNEVNEHWRADVAKLHWLGQPPESDKVVYEETEDEGFGISVHKSQDERWIFFTTSDNVTSELRFVPADAPESPLTLIAPRVANRDYSVDAAHGKFWILVNDEHVNFRIAEATPEAPGVWTTVVPGSDRVYLRGLTSYRDHLAITARVDGLDQLILRTYEGVEERVPFTEASYTADFQHLPEYAPAAYRIHYSSMVTPATVYDYHPAEKRLEVLKVAEIPSGYDASQYVTERLMLPARDGVRVPVSIVYKKGFEKNGQGKVYLYAYGAYGHAIPPRFSITRLSLLDRGYACAIAHIRGGDDLGFNWYLDGKLTKRTNTFNDFVDVAKGLVSEGFTAPGRIAIQGGSAGGELMGVVANDAPELWGAVVADVPFVDVLATMLDGTLPLTPREWPEWGNPLTDKAAFQLLQSYSPYDNVTAKAYPPMLLTGGLNDPRVTYWEPAKWAAKLREVKTDQNLLLLKINMEAGHGGRSGRWESLREDAEAFAFILTQVK